MTGTKLLALGLATGFLVVAMIVSAAPAPLPRQNGDKWEYCEVHHSFAPARAAIAGVAGRGGIGGGGAAGGGGRGGGMPGGRVRKPSIRLIIDGEETETSSWADLAAKLKAPAAKQDASPAVHKLRVFNQLGRSGWELVGQNRETSSADDVWTFKRKVVK